MYVAVAQLVKRSSLALRVSVQTKVVREKFPELSLSHLAAKMHVQKWSYSPCLLFA